MTMDDMDALSEHMRRLYSLSFLLLLVEDCGPIPESSGFDEHIAETTRYYLLRAQFEELCATREKLLHTDMTV